MSVSEVAGENFLHSFRIVTPQPIKLF